ncbi:MAG: class E sortase [Actinobacteria bacterium]|nr:MAG: class E sortase [Actinomycetota bacterium]
MFALGALLLAETAITLLWKEPITSFLAARDQRHLRSELAALERRTLAVVPGQVRAIRDQRTRLRATLRYFARTENASTRPGHALARIRIGRLHLSYVVVQGSGAASLRRGPAHYSQTPLPGETGTVAIAGHRTTYLAPFRHLDDLRGGNRLSLDAPYGSFTYAVERRVIVPAGYRSAFDFAGYDRLVLTACHPLYSATQRILVYARLIDIRPSAQALARAHAQIAELPAPPPLPASPAAAPPGGPPAAGGTPARLPAREPPIAGPGPWGALEPVAVVGGGVLGVVGLALLAVWGFLGVRRGRGDDEPGSRQRPLSPEQDARQ